MCIHPSWERSIASADAHACPSVLLTSSNEVDCGIVKVYQVVVKMFAEGILHGAWYVTMFLKTRSRVLGGKAGMLSGLSEGLGFRLGSKVIKISTLASHFFGILSCPSQSFRQRLHQLYDGDESPPWSQGFHNACSLGISLFVNPAPTTVDATFTSLRYIMENTPIG